MGELVSFNYQQSAVRVVMRDGEPWFVAKDVCDVLGYSNSRMALERLDDDEKGVSTIYTHGGPQEMSVVNEPGLYSLILTSRKPEARQFKRWVTHEVLPSIRKTGKYESETLKAKNADKRLEIMELNAKTRQAKLLLEMTHRFKDRLSDTAIESMLALSANVLTGRELVPLPPTERLYTATEIAEMVGSSANKVGRVANELCLKTSEYGMYVLDKSPHSSKQVEAFRYNKRGKERLLEYFTQQKNGEGVR